MNKLKVFATIASPSVNTQFSVVLHYDGSLC